MSWSVWLEIDTGGEYPAEVCEVGDMTYNVSPMYFKACPIGGLRDFEKMLARRAVPHLETMIANMKAQPEVYKALNPENGWGNYDVALEFIEKLLDACKKHPKARIAIS